MSRMSRLIPTLVVVCVLAACGDSGSTPLSPDGPSYDTGVGSGGGNREGESTTTPPSTTTQSDTTTRSGVGSGGGN